MSNTAINKQNQTIEILPKHLELLVHNIKPNWSFEKHEQFLLNQSNLRYTLLRDQNELAYKILQHLAYLNGSGIDFKLIKDLLTTDPLDSSSEQASLKLNEALAYLVKTTFLKCKFDYLANTKCYEIHEIIQNEIKEILEICEKDKILNRVVKTLARSLKNNKSRKNVEKISDHALKIKDETWQTRKSKSTKNECLINLFLKVGTLNENVVCDLDRAKLGFIELLKLIKDDDEMLSENTKTNYPQLLGDTLNNLGNLCYKTKEMERALEYYRESLSVKRQSLSAVDVSIGGTLNNMARVYFEKNEFDEALRCYTESYEIYR